VLFHLQFYEAPSAIAGVIHLQFYEAPSAIAGVISPAILRSAFLHLICCINTTIDAILLVLPLQVLFHLQFYEAPFCI